MASRSPKTKSNSSRFEFEKQFAKSYGHGGFYRANIIQSSAVAAETLDVAGQKEEAESQYMNQTMARIHS